MWKKGITDFGFQRIAQEQWKKSGQEDRDTNNIKRLQEEGFSPNMSVIYNKMLDIEFVLNTLSLGSPLSDEEISNAAQKAKDVLQELAHLKN